MSKRNKLPAPTFKAYDQNQAYLLPPSLEELIPANHPVRVVNKVIESIDLSALTNAYSGGGRSSFNPKLMLKVIVYAYLTNVYSSRKIETALRESIPFMWLAGMATPDHNTINRFRTNRVQNALEHIFKEIVLLLADQGLLDIKQIYTDGTIIEANANRYTFVWAKAVKGHKERIANEFNRIWEYAQKLASQEMTALEEPDFNQITPERLEESIQAIHEILKQKEVAPAIKKKINHGKKNWPTQLRAYQKHEQILQERGSYSKTDPDATFMRTKDDHLSQGQLKPCYNPQLSSNNQFVISYTIAQTSSDSVSFIPHLQNYKDTYECLPDLVCADAGFGSEENLAFLENHDIQAFVKYPEFHRQQTKPFSRPFEPALLHYSPEKNCYICPMGQTMSLTSLVKRKTNTGFEQTISTYKAQRCQDCPMRGPCYDGSENRGIAVNHNLNRLKVKAKLLLTSEQGLVHRRRRATDVETIFGNVKYNHGFTRFMLRGKEKVQTELGWVLMAHNLRKCHKILQKTLN